MTTAPTPDLRALAEAAKDWTSCNEAWPHPEDIYVAVVGGITDGEQYPVAQVEADNYGTDGESLKLAQFYAAANPGAVLALLDRLDALQADNERLRADLEARKPLPGLDAMRMGMEVARECRGHATGTTNWATAMTRAYERRLCGITGGSS